MAVQSSSQTSVLVPARAPVRSSPRPTRQFGFLLEGKEGASRRARPRTHAEVPPRVTENRQAMSSAIAQAQEMQAATEQDSLLMLKTMLLLSLNSIAHIRGLFPESQFSEVDMKSSALDGCLIKPESKECFCEQEPQAPCFLAVGIKFKKLKPTCSDSKRFLLWIDKGARAQLPDFV